MSTGDLIPPPPPDKERDQENSVRSFAKVSKYMHLGFVLPSAVFLGWILGALLDRWLGTSWGTLAGILFGIVVGFYEIIRVALSMGKEK